ncbi:hypothetical protein KFK09_002334 [Dendrobium nobile]|uniref:Uncharacterized protein n=1 Tax=Dendrobium nobile TaxID=94219 RepID=A0A8T3C6Y2_DENNO|nr:hypothetical protein KFK09_002334 [Dendrobium nobile]
MGPEEASDGYRCRLERKKCQIFVWRKWDFKCVGEEMSESWGHGNEPREQACFVIVFNGPMEKLFARVR